MNDYGAIVIITTVIATITPMKTIKPQKTGKNPKKKRGKNKKQHAALTIVNAVADFSADCFADN